MIGQVIKEKRKNKGFTQKELAEKTGLSLSAIEKYENGARVPSLETLINLGKVLNCSLIGLQLALQKNKTNDAIDKLIQTYIDIHGLNINLNEYLGDCRISELKQNINKLIDKTLLNINKEDNLS